MPRSGRLDDPKDWGASGGCGCPHCLMVLRRRDSVSGLTVMPRGMKVRAV